MNVAVLNLLEHVGDTGLHGFDTSQQPGSLAITTFNGVHGVSAHKKPHTVRHEARDSRLICVAFAKQHRHAWTERYDLDIHHVLAAVVLAQVGHCEHTEQNISPRFRMVQTPFRMRRLGVS